jgi:isopropylmalate/homocitrate/citramalate synthase
MLIEEDRIPEDVTIVVLTQAREDLIRRTVESVRGARRATVHLYNPIAPAWRRIVFNASREEIKEVAVSGTRLIRADRCHAGHRMDLRVLARNLQPGRTRLRWKYRTRCPPCGSPTLTDRWF